MMIDPEYYYDMIKAKSKEEILTEIRRLKREINRLKKVLEDPCYLQTMFPGESTQLSFSQMYLNKAKLAHAQAGGTYKPTKAEKKRSSI